MPRFHKLRHLHHSPELLFEIVLAIEQYPQFLPWCLEAKVRTRRESSLIGDMRVGYGVASRTFRSYVKFDKTKGTVDMQADNSIFSHFESQWSILQDSSNRKSSATRVNFFINFELHHNHFGFIFERLFRNAAERMVEAFEKRADDIAPIKIDT